MFSNFGASLRTLFGGEVGGYTTLLTDSRNQAIERLRIAARERGGNAVLAMRFDCNEIADLMSEIAAYGTAAIVRPRGEPIVSCGVTGTSVNLVADVAREDGAWRARSCQPPRA